MILLALPLWLPAQDLASRLEDTRLPLRAADGGFSGPGAAYLEAAAAESAFFLIGEQHGNRETPELTRWLLGKLKPLGYDVFAAEVGPRTAARLAETASGDEPLTALEELHRAYPFAIPFFWWVEEARLLVDAERLGFDLWGLDQEFVGSVRLHLDRLRALAPGRRALDLVAAHEERAWAAMDSFLATGNTGSALLHQLTAEEFAALEEAFAEAGDEALSIVRELRRSAHVYRLFGQGRNYESNHERIRLMKEHLAAYLRDASPRSRVLMKFGNVHTGRGYSPLNQLDLGNQAAELALVRGGESFHLSVVGLGREELDGSVADYRGALPWLAALGDVPAGEDDEWFVLDLRSLRPYFHDEARRAEHPELAAQVWRFDALVVVPRLRADEYLVEFGR